MPRVGTLQVEGSGDSAAVKWAEVFPFATIHVGARAENNKPALVTKLIAKELLMERDCHTTFSSKNINERH